MKILKGRNGVFSTLLDFQLRVGMVYAENGSVILSTGFRGKKLAYKIVLSPMVLRAVRNACNKALTQIDGFERHTTVTIAECKFKEAK